MLSIGGNRIEGVIFDMDGLMYDTEMVFIETVAQAGKEYGYEITREIALGALGMNVDAIRSYFLDVFGNDFPFWEIRERRLKLTIDYCINNGMPCKPGLYELVDYLYTNDIPLAVATSSEKARPTLYLDISNLSDKFSCVLSGEDATKSKPDPQIFQLAAQKIGADIHNCIILEDSINGIKAAIASGGYAIMIPDNFAPTPEIQNSCFAILPTLKDVIDIFDK